MRLLRSTKLGNGFEETCLSGEADCLGILSSQESSSPGIGSHVLFTEKRQRIEEWSWS